MIQHTSIVLCHPMLFSYHVSLLRQINVLVLFFRFQVILRLTAKNIKNYKFSYFGLENSYQCCSLAGELMRGHGLVHVK